MSTNLGTKEVIASLINKLGEGFAAGKLEGGKCAYEFEDAAANRFDYDFTVLDSSYEFVSPIGAKEVEEGFGEGNLALAGNSHKCSRDLLLSFALLFVNSLTETKGFDTGGRFPLWLKVCS